MSLGNAQSDTIIPTLPVSYDTNTEIALKDAAQQVLMTNRVASLQNRKSLEKRSTSVNTTANTTTNQIYTTKASEQADIQTSFTKNILEMYTQGDIKYKLIFYLAMFALVILITIKTKPNQKL